MWLIVKQLLIKDGWQDAPLALQDLAGTTYTISTALTAVTPSLVITRFSHYLLHSQFNFPNILVCSDEFHAIKVLPHNPHLNIDIVEENLSKPGFQKQKHEILVSTSIFISLSNHEPDDVISASTRVITYCSQKTKVPKETKFYPPLDLSTNFIRGEIKIVFFWDLISIFLVGRPQL